MGKVKLTRDQHEILEKLVDEYSREFNEDDAKGQILKDHIVKGWHGTSMESLGELSVSQMGIVLFAGMYEIYEPTFMYQECIATYRLNEHTIIENTVIQVDEYELRETEIIAISLENIRALGIQVDESMFEAYEIVRKEKE